MEESITEKVLDETLIDEGNEGGTEMVEMDSNDNVLNEVEEDDFDNEPFFPIELTSPQPIFEYGRDVDSPRSLSNASVDYSRLSSELTFSDSETEDTEVIGDKLTWRDKVRVINTRSHVNNLQGDLQERQNIVSRSREELKKCKEQVKSLERQKNQTEKELQRAVETSNVPAMSRLQAAYLRMCEELDTETKLLIELQNSVSQSEYKLLLMEVEKGAIQCLERNLENDEKQWAAERAREAKSRGQKEKKLAENCVRMEHTEQKMLEKLANERNTMEQQMRDEIQQSRNRHQKHLERTLARAKANELNQKLKEEAFQEQQIKSVLTLKRDLDANQLNVRALNARNAMRAREAKEVEKQWKATVASEQGDLAVYKEQRLQHFRQQRKTMLEEQKRREVEIVEKILNEEQLLAARKKNQPYLFADRIKDSLKLPEHPRREKKSRILEALQKSEAKPEPAVYDLSKFEGMTGDESDNDEDEQDGNTDVALISETSSHIFEDDDAVVLAEPEFAGMWDKRSMKPASEKVKTVTQRCNRMEQLRETRVVKQVVGGRELKGRAFYSKPDVIVFKDFDVGGVYEKKVQLTNITNSLTYCKLTGLSEQLKDFVTLEFKPPGQMSAGLTCDLRVTFKPMLNQDLEGEIEFLAQTGPFSIPVRCLTKKCELKVDATVVDFGTAVIGETLHKTIVLSNNGALGTSFRFEKLSGLPPPTEVASAVSIAMSSAFFDASVSAASLAAGPDAETNLQSPDKIPVALPSTRSRRSQKAASGVSLAQNTTVPVQQSGVLAAQRSGASGAPRIQVSAASLNKDNSMAQMSFISQGQEVVLKTSDASSIALSTTSGMDDVMEVVLDEMRTGETMFGEILPHSSIKLEIVWQPTFPGPVSSDFLVSFGCTDTSAITVNAAANAIDVPVWIERPNLDLKICTFDRLYQDTIIVHNRAKTALKLHFDVDKELRHHLEILPHNGYIQAQSKFCAQLKFLPRKSLPVDAEQYFDPATGVFEAGLNVTVANQTRPVPFSVHAVVTTSDLEFNVREIDFGFCTIHEAVTHTVQLTNHAILPQEYGFVGLPEFMEVQPGDGFGTILPNETIDIDVIFHPLRAGEFNCEVTCKSIINREFKLTCRGIGVHPPLDLSHQIVHFKATALNDVSIATLLVTNSHLDKQEYRHPVPRIGKGEIAPIGPTSFEFFVPDGVPLTVSPAVGTLSPGSKCKVNIRFQPTLSEADIRREAVHLVMLELERQAEEKRQAELERERILQEQQASLKTKKGSKMKVMTPKGSKNSDFGALQDVSSLALEPPTEESIVKNSKEYNAGLTSLVHQFTSQFSSYQIPCYIASGPAVKDLSSPPAYNVANTLYLEVHCPVIRPDLIVISNGGQTVTDFGDSSVGHRVVKTVTIQNISDHSVDLHSSSLNTDGTFCVVNALRSLEPNATHNVHVAFTPQHVQQFQETLDIKCLTSVLHVTLKGRGVSPGIDISVTDGLLDMGYVQAGDIKEHVFTIANTSPLSVEYSVRLGSEPIHLAQRTQLSDSFRRSDHLTDHVIGTQNYNSQQVFDCVPSKGVIDADATKEITLTFAPDHPSLFYSDICYIDLFGQKDSHSFQLKGCAVPHIMYVRGTDSLVPEVQSLSATPHADSDEAVVPVLVTLHSIASETGFTTATREVLVGCVKSTLGVVKKGGGSKQSVEWNFDAMPPGLGFTIDPIKGNVEPGAEKPVTISWTPPAGHDSNAVLSTTINCNVRGDVSETYSFLLRAFVNTD